MRERGAQGGLRAPFPVPPGPGAQPPAGPSRASSAARLAKRPRSPGGSPGPLPAPGPGHPGDAGRATLPAASEGCAPLTSPGAVRDTRPQKCRPRASGPQQRRRRAATGYRSRLEPRLGAVFAGPLRGGAVT